MGAKRSVEGRSRRYDDLLLDWQRANNPNFVEPVKRESKAEKKAQREREKQERKRLASEAAAAVGAEISAAKKVTAAASSAKKASKKAAAAAAAVRLADGMGNDTPEDLDDLDSETELDDLVRSVQAAQEKKVIGVPLAVPCDAGSWFVQRRERVRCCRDLFMAALRNDGNGIQGPGVVLMNRTASAGSAGTNAALRV